MKKITISLPDEVHRRACLRAAEKETSVSGLVMEFLVSLGEQESEFERRKRLQTEVMTSIKNFSARYRLRRDRIYL